MIMGIEKRFIPCFISTATVSAVIAPYLSIMLRDLGYSPLWVGILLGIYEVAAMTGPLLTGYWADRTGNYRSVLIVSCVLPALVVLPLVRLIHPAVSAVLLAMMAFGVRSTISLLDAVTTIQIGRTGNYGRIRVWGSLSFILVTLCLQWNPFLKPHNAGNIGSWLMLTSVVAALPVLLLPGALLKSTPSTKHDTAETAEGKTMPILSAYVLGGFGMIFLSRIAMTSIYTYFPLYMVETLHWDAVGVMFAVATASEVPLMFVSRSLIRRFGSLPLLAVSVVGLCVRLLIMALLPFKPFIVMSQMLHSLCFGVYYPAAVDFIAGIFPAKRRGTGMSVYLIVGSGLPALISNIAGGAIVQAAGYRPLFAIYAGVAAAAFLIYRAMRRYNERVKVS
jgi:PPP family 3-phenylpropionic acid transporter